MQIGTIVKKIKKILNKINRFWFDHYGLFFLLIFISVSLFGAYLLYKNIYLSDWSDEKKQEYISSKQSVTTLKKDQFDQVIQSINRRHGFSERRFEPINNIFELPQQ
ncbi:MAG: hypothetical protein OEV93_01315 [Candidatus Moranbacteria bacterium]|nr:hypothetical protein [Candidatus Moranbacteria bacterium]